MDALVVMDVESDDPRIDTWSPSSTQRADRVARRASDDPVVDFDFEAAGWLAVDRLKSLGHRRIALIGSPPEVMKRHTSYAERLARGFLRRVKRAGWRARSTHSRAARKPSRHRPGRCRRSLDHRILRPQRGCAATRRGTPRRDRSPTRRRPLDRGALPGGRRPADPELVDSIAVPAGDRRCRHRHDLGDSRRMPAPASDCCPPYCPAASSPRARSLTGMRIDPESRGLNGLAPSSRSWP